MTNGFKIFLFLGFIGVLALAHAHEVQETSKEEDESHMSFVLFNGTSKSLTGTEKSELHNFVQSTRRGKKITGLKVLAWADRASSEFQGAGTQQEIDLADARGEAIKSFLWRDLRMEAVTYNMAEDPSQLVSILEANNYNLKSFENMVEPKKGYYEDSHSTTAVVLVATE